LDGLGGLLEMLLKWVWNGIEGTNERDTDIGGREELSTNCQLRVLSYNNSQNGFLL